MVNDSKDALRAKMRQRRAGVPAADRAAAAHRLAQRFVEAVPLAEGQTVALYWPLEDELDTRPLMEMLAARDIGLALPVVVRAGQPLLFRRWDLGQPLIEGHFGVKVPAESAEAVHPDVIGVPLLAFDAEGHRLGYGGGYYDRTLEAMQADGRAPPVTVGLAYEQQRMGWLPRHEGDQPLDMVVTDHAVHKTDIRRED